MSVADAAKQSRLEALRATRDKLAEAIDAGGGTLPQAVAQFRGVLTEIEELAPTTQQKVTGLSEFEKRLRERAAPKSPRRARTKTTP